MTNKTNMPKLYVCALRIDTHYVCLDVLNILNKDSNFLEIKFLEFTDRFIRPCCCHLGYSEANEFPLQYSLLSKIQKLFV